MALVEPAIALCTIRAFSTDLRVMKWRGFKSSHTISTMRRPHIEAIRGCAESPAGMEAAPGSVRPRASAMVVMVEAVPIVMHVPAERAIPASMSFHCCSLILPASFSAQYFQTSEPEPRMLPPK